MSRKLALWASALIAIVVIGGACSTAWRPTETVPTKDNVHTDPASQFASTGNPQLLEFFTYW